MKKAEMGMMQNKPTPGSINGQRGLPLDKKIQEGIKSGKLNKDGTTKNPFPKKKMGGTMKKAKNGFDLNKDGKTTFKDVLIGRGVLPKKAMMGTGMHKMPDGSMMKNSMMKMGGAMAKQAAVAIAMKKEGKTPKKKMQYGGEAASMAPMKKGGSMKKCKYGCK